MEPTRRSQVCCLIPNPSEETRAALAVFAIADAPRETGPLETGPRETGHACYESKTTSSVKCHYSPALAASKSRCSPPLSAHPLGRAAFLQHPSPAVHPRYPLTRTPRLGRAALLLHPSPAVPRSFSRAPLIGYTHVRLTSC